MLSIKRQTKKSLINWIIWIRAIQKGSRVWQGHRIHKYQAINLSDFQGKVVLVDFWTYSCINCIRTIPYLVEWSEKYADNGLVIIGVHAPEFEFEKNIENVKAAVKKFGIKYPVI